MRSFLTLFAVSLFLTFLFIPPIRRWARALGAVDFPNNDRRIHRRPTPRLGGVAIYLAFAMTLLCVPWLGTTISQSFVEDWRWYTAIMLPATLVFGLGVYDDLRGANAKVKLAVQFLAAVLLYAFGFGIMQLSLPLGGAWVLPTWGSFLLTLVWVIGITNAFNLVDGIDGLGAGASAFALLSVLFFSSAVGQMAVALVAVILVGAVIGFLFFNFHPATIFLGDSGSLWLGFMIAALSLAGSQKGTTVIAIAIPLVSFGLPVLEVGLSIIRRLVGRKSLLEGDRGHIHHRLLANGFTQKQAAILLYGVCALFALFGILLLNPARSSSALIFFIIGVLTAIGVWKLRYPEFEQLGSRVRRKVFASAGKTGVPVARGGKADGPESNSLAKTEPATLAYEVRK